MTTDEMVRPEVGWDVAGQDAAARSLRDAVTAEELGHAWLLVGPRDVGQQELAVALAAAVNCPNAAHGVGCGACEVCRRTNGGSHTALVSFEPEGANHLIGTVREEWLPEAYRTLVEGNRRIMRIVAADLMNEAAQNAFLKALEEPGPSTVWLLEAEDDRALLETIVSRCRRLDLSPWGPEDLTVRGRELGLPEHALPGLVRAANGSPRRLQSLAGYECPLCGKAFRMARLDGVWRLPENAYGEDGVLRCDNRKAKEHKQAGQDEVALVRDRGRELHLGVIDAFHTRGPGIVSGWVGDVMARADGRKKAVAAVHDEAMTRLQEDLGITAGRGWPPGMKARIDKQHRREQREAVAEAVVECFDDLGSLLRDVLVVQGGGADADLVNVDRAAEIRVDAQHIAADEVITGLADLAWARQATWEFNAVPALQLERVLLPLAVGVYRATH